MSLMALSALCAAVLVLVAVLVRSGPGQAPIPPSAAWATAVVDSCGSVDLPKCTGQAIARAALDDPSMVFPASAAIAAAAPGAYDCHVAMHYAALELVKTHSAQDLLAYYEPTCLDGFSHGVLEAFALVSDSATFESEVMSLCDQFTMGTIESDTCYHGLGHAFMIKTPSSLAAAARRCADLGETYAALCGQGVFMSYTNEGGPSLGGLDLGITLDRLSTEEASELCQSLPDSVAPACWDMAWLLFDPSKVSVVDSMVSLCADSGNFSDMCYEGLGLAIFFRDGLNPPPDPAPFKAYVLEHLASCPSGAALVACTRGVSYAGTLWWGSFQDSLESYLSVCSDMATDRPDLVAACRDGESRIAAEAQRPMTLPSLPS